ncbi:MAG: N-acylglucosamine 2-epimerase [Ruminococcaceae bacterium]|nr:N-acylglucosamine 2-epimerase [Oscillospiraceae bacterium]
MIDRKQELEFYKKELYEQVLPFWEKYTPDMDFGGVFTCFSNNGGEMLSEDKYIWSQGRMLWVLSRILKHADVDGERFDKLSRLADKTAEFLMAKSRLENGNCVFLTDREGNIKLSGGVYDASFYADCFVILGTAEYASYRKDYDALAFSLDLYLHTRERVESGNFRTDPYPVPKGYRTHGITMILTNTARTLADAMADLCHPDADVISNQAYAYAKDTLDSFTDENGILHEMVRVDGTFDNESQIGRYVNPGHTIEDCWFMETEWKRFGDTERYEKTKRVLKNALRLGWDAEYSGVRLFADMEGGDPHGTIPDPSEPMVKKTTEDNGSKLWWVHSESLYSTLLFGEDEEIAAWYPKIREYTFNTFPNTENDRGEWIQIRSRDGKPENRIVALPVKDPFHILRNLLLIIELLKK